MRSKENIILSNQICGSFFIILAVVALFLSGLDFDLKSWGLALCMLPCTFLFGSIGWLAVAGTFRSDRPPGCGGHSGPWGAGRPVPIRPSPTHHLVGMKDLPPADKTHSLPKD